MERKHVIIYTDGCCLGNPGQGGYGVVLLYGDHRKQISGGFRLTTNNRMELTAAIVGLKALKYNCKVSLYSDSKYLVEAFNQGWIENWRKNGWRTSKKGDVQNIDLWKQLYELYKKHEITFFWVRGHAGNKENETCDKLAMEAANRNDLPPDIKFETENKEII
jgi:ribonuclease HI